MLLEKSKNFFLHMPKKFLEMSKKFLDTSKKLLELSQQFLRNVLTHLRIFLEQS